MTIQTQPPQLRAAYSYCAAVLRMQARNFSYGVRLLPPPKRQAMEAIYALARRIDDIGDGDLSIESKSERLQDHRAMLAQLRAGGVELEDVDPVKIALADAIRRYAIPLDAFDDLIDGVEMDVRGTEYQAFDDLRGYCRRVAGSIGRLSLGVFGCDDLENGNRYADSLGIALQLTNILRDVREDAVIGRTYLPQEDLSRFGCDAGFAPRVSVPRAGFTELVAFEVERAQEFYAEGLRLLPMLDPRSRACVGTMAGIYHRLLARIGAKPHTVLQRRLSLPPWEKVFVAVSWAGPRPS